MMMLGHTAANGKKSSKFEDSDSSRMSRPSRAVSELPQRPAAQHLKSSSSAGTEASGGTPRRAPGVRGTTAPRSPLQEKKPAASVSGGGPRVAELEAKLEKAYGQLQGMREQLAAAEKARKDARAALVEAKKRLAAKKKDDLADHGGGKEPASSAPEASERDNAEKSYVAVAPRESAVMNKNSDGEETSNVVDDDFGDKKPSPEVETLRAKLTAKDMEVYELRARLMVIDTEVDDLRGKLVARGTEVDELKAALMSSNELVDKLAATLLVKDAEIAALEADNADLTKTAEEAAEATAARARETEHALRKSAEREARLAERLRASDHSRDALEAEAQRLRVQSEQWRKAAEEAAAVLGSGGGAVDNGVGAYVDKRRRRSGSACAGGNGGKAAKDGDDDDDEGASGKRKAGGGAMRVLSDLWKKKAQK
uniref:Interactor of constitutive active ROPs 1 n=1 Tax=Zea mays TaxID=4577 RepID=A0A804QR91_MAIZE